MTDLPTSLPCSTATLRQPHPPHDWEPQPGMDPVHCPGGGQPEATEATEPAETATAPWTQLEARASNAVQPALREAGEWLPLSARRKVARAVLAELLEPVEAGTDTATWTAVRAIQLMNEAGRERDEARAAIARVRDFATRMDEFAENALRVDDRKLYGAIASDLRTRIDGPAVEPSTDNLPDTKEA
ncbi:hypothetical protein AB0D47_20090 [Streptomyces sp. NPDC048376]|uniref:hypothetical protein n=1 Tax=Streptomyces sp. NPDC048376 TaxID=3154926 RepID=UPI00344AB8F2